MVQQRDAALVSLLRVLAALLVVCLLPCVCLCQCSSGSSVYSSSYANAAVFDVEQIVWESPIPFRQELSVAVSRTARSYSGYAQNGSLASFSAPAGSLILFSGSNAGTPTNDVWLSVSGGLWQSWYLVAGTASIPAGQNGNSNSYSVNAPAASFAPQQGAAGCSDPSTGQLYVIGGANSAGSWNNSVWTSTDAVSWSSPGSLSQWLAYAFCAVGSDGTVYSVGGSNMAVSPRGAASFTVPSPATYPSPWRDNTFGAVVPNPYYGVDLVYMAGGNSAGDSSYFNNLFNDVWCSSDRGNSWARLTQNAQWAARSSTQMAVSSGGVMVVTGGYANYVPFADCWASVDGGYTVSTAAPLTCQTAAAAAAADADCPVCPCPCSLRSVVADQRQPGRSVVRQPVQPGSLLLGCVRGRCGLPVHRAGRGLVRAGRRLLEVHQHAGSHRRLGTAGHRGQHGQRRVP